MRPNILFVLLITFASLFSNHSTDSSQILLLTPEERTWISKHQNIIVGAGSEWAPFNFINDEGVYSGIAHDYLTLISKLSGLKFTYTLRKTWNENLEAFKHKKVDMLPAVYYTKERETYGNFSKPFFKLREFIYFRDDNKAIHSIDDLKGKVVAMPKGYATIKVLRAYSPNITILETESIFDAIKAVLTSEADALIEGQSVISYILDQNMMNGLKGIPQTLFDPSSIFFLTAKEQPHLHAIIQKTLAVITETQRRDIHNKWVQHGLIKKVNMIKFTEHEQKWIRQHQGIRFTGDPNWLPFEAFDTEGNYIGIVADLLEIVQERTGLSIHKMPTKTWSESVALLKNTQVDMLTETTDSVLRSEYLFTHSFLKNPIIIVMDQHQNYVDKLEQISDKRIAVIKDYGYVPKILKKYPDIHFHEVDNIQDGLSNVAEGKYDALLCTMALGSYTMTRMQLSNIKVVGKTEFATQIGFAVRKDYPELVSILNRVFDSIDQETAQNFLSKWIKFEYVEKIDYTLIWQIAFIALLIISGTLFWNRKLKKEIAHRISLQKEVDNANKLLTDSIQFASLIQQAFIPENSDFEIFFDDYFTIWAPRDIVGGDIYFLNPLRHEDELLLMVIDCTGHGVPGAFVTMLVKAIERQMISHIANSDEVVSPAELLSIFNRSIKHLLKQHDKSSVSNAGFDAGIVYINRKEKRALYAGANIPLFYIQEGNLTTIKGNRHSIGYKTSNVDYIFTNHEITLDKTVHFYITTDGYIDQNGGEKEFPMGKSKFKKAIEQNYLEPMQQQKVKLLDQLYRYQGSLSRNDDVTVVGFTLKGDKDAS